MYSFNGCVACSEDSVKSGCTTSLLPMDLFFFLNFVNREEINASLNAVVSDISSKIKEQEEERIAQDTENANLRTELQVPYSPACF